MLEVVGKVGYIPFSFCKELESSKEVGSTYNETGFTEDFSDIPELTNSRDSKSVSKLSENLNHRRRSGKLLDNYNGVPSSVPQVVTKTEKRVHFADQPKSRNSCDICRNFLTSFNSIDYNTTNGGQKKVNLKPHKLLKLLQTISKEGFVNIGNSRSTYNAQSFFGQITDNRINRKVNSSEFPVKFGNFCNQCDVLKEIFKNADRYSMSDLYSTIRNLHLHALEDSDSDQDENNENSDGSEKQNGRLHENVHNVSASEKMPKRSTSFKEPELKQKVDIVRNNSFSGITEVERNGLVNGSFSSAEEPNTTETDKLSITAIACTRAAKITHIKSVDNNTGQRNQKINNYFPENQQCPRSSHLTNGYDEQMTDFRGAVYQPPLINKWRPANGSFFTEDSKQRPPGIVREQTFEYDSIKSRNTEVNFNDPKKENLNLTNIDESKNLKMKLQTQTRNFTTDSRRKPIVSNGNFSLDDNEDIEPHEPTLSNSSRSGAITKCFTTYEQSARFHIDTNTGKSLTLDRNFKTSSHFSDRETVDKAENPNHENAYQGHDNHFPKQTENDCVSDRPKVVARKVNHVTSPRNFMTANGPLMGKKNDKDIRKSLLEHSAIQKRTVSNQSEPMRAQPLRAQPMRAQHDIASQNEAATSSGRTVLVKKFNKQMWRPSLAGSEGSDQRPFSPFGGTLPPSKIVKKKVVEVFV